MDRLYELLGDQPVEAVAGLHVEDLHLVWACIEANPDALSALETKLRQVVDATLARLRIDPGRRDDLVQDLRIHLVVGSETAPGKLAQYRGHGGLDGWLRATALRAAYRLARKVQRYVALDDTALAAVSAFDHDPALAALKARCRIELKNAFTAAVAALPRRDRLLLKQHYLDQLTIEDVAALHQIHRSSAARWLAQARTGLTELVLREFRDRLGIPGIKDSEVDSLVLLVRSQLDVTLDCFLAVME